MSTLAKNLETMSQNRKHALNSQTWRAIRTIIDQFVAEIEALDGESRIFDSYLKMVHSDTISYYRFGPMNGIVRDGSLKAIVDCDCWRREDHFVFRQIETLSGLVVEDKGNYFNLYRPCDWKSTFASTLPDSGHVSSNTENGLDLSDLSDLNNLSHLFNPNTRNKSLKRSVPETPPTTRKSRSRRGNSTSVISVTVPVERTDKVSDRTSPPGNSTLFARAYDKRKHRCYP
jgi:hypothetical protein